MKLHKILFIVCLVVVGIFSFFATQYSGAQEQNQQAYDIACDVKDVPTLKDCFEKAKNGEYNLIKITRIIECTSKDDCAIDLSNLHISLKIYGTSTDTGFKRIGNFDYSLFTIKNSSDIIIGGFLIDDTSSGDCSAQGISCPPAMIIDASKNIVIDQLRTKAVKNSGISVKDASSITIKNSVFADSSGTAVVFLANSGENIITNNTFTHNHKASFFQDCVGICIGAQVSILPNTKNLTVSKNTIKDGSIDVYGPLGLYASGIDIAGENVEAVTVSCNTISNNSGNGIVIGQQQASTKDITIGKNKLYGNGIDVNVIGLPQNTIENNCFDASCKVEGC